MYKNRMNGLENEHICPKCGSHRLKTWHDLTSDEKFLAERLPLSAEYTAAEQKSTATVRGAGLRKRKREVRWL